MWRVTAPTKSKLFRIQSKYEAKVYFYSNKVYEISTIRKHQLVMTLDENTRFSIVKVDKKGDKTHFTFLVRSLALDLYIKIDSHEDLKFCFEYLGYFGIGIGLQIIISDLEKIGRGNFATVYKLTTNFGDVRALKMFDKRKLQRNKNSASFANEIKVMRHLNSQYIVKLDCFYETEKTYYLQMEYFEETLKNYLKKPRTQGRRKQILKDLLLGLKDLGEGGVVHRDIKPDNIMLRKLPDSGLEQFVLIDLGLARNLADPEPVHKRCGTPGYIAPEIANQNQSGKAGPSSDMFSLGATFFYILTGKKAFQGATKKQVLTKNKAVALQENQLYYMSENETDLLRKMLEKDPTKRISVEEALTHPYFNCEPDDQDVVSHEECQLSQKVQSLKIMNKGSKNLGVILLYSISKGCRKQTHPNEDITGNIVDEEFQLYEKTRDDDSLHDEEIKKIVQSKRV